MYGEVKKDLVEIIKKLCEMKQVQIIEGKVCNRHPEYRQKWTDRHFWARGYYVSTVGSVNEETIIQYIREQEENDKLEDGRK